jgi:beta-phosphoglucomutase-like phosphatase (HAD superfamily)
MRRLDVDPASCIVVEDSGSGIHAGKKAGAHVVAVPNPALMPSPDALQAADTTLSSLEHFPQYVMRLSRP